MVKDILKKYNRFYKNVVVLNAYATSFLFVFVFFYYYYIFFFSDKGIVPALLLLPSASSWQTATVDGSWHLSTPPSLQARAELWVLAREKNKLPHSCYLQVSGQMCFEVRGRRTVASSGFPITVTLQCFPVFCCCSVFSGFVLSCFLHQHQNKGQKPPKLILLYGFTESQNS